MADYLPQNAGNWSTTTWITAFSNLTAFAGGNLPPASIDDVYTDGKFITIDTNINVLSLRTTTSPRTGGLAGGGFFINNSVSLTAISIIVGTTTCLTFLSASPNSCNIVGNIIGSGTTNSIFGLNNSSTGIVTISGNHVGGSGAAVTRPYAIQNTTTGTINVIGSIRGGTSGDNPYCLHNASTGTVNITGDVIGGASGAGPGYGVNNQSSGIINILGNVTAGTGSLAYGANNASTGTINVTGTIAGVAVNNNFGIGNTLGTINVVGVVVGGAGNAAYGISNTGAAPCLVTVSGSVSGGTGNTADGIRNVSTGTILVTGTVVGGNSAASTYGILNNGTGQVFVYGSVIGGIGSGTNSGLGNGSTGFIYATRAVGNGWGLGSAGIGAAQVGMLNTQNGRAYVEQVEFGSRGATPISGPVYILPSNRNTLVGYTTALGAPVTFYNSLSVSNLLPPTSSVRLGTVYNVGNSTGTMAVPSASAVQVGVAVDNTTGTAALRPQDVWGYARLSATQINSLGDRLRNVATTQSVGQQIASFNL